MKHTIHVPGTRCTLNVNIENFPTVQNKLDRIAKTKPRKPTIKAEKRLFPLYGKHMNTKDYVREYWMLNFKGASFTDCEAFYEPLSTQPQEWPSEPLYEVLDEVEGVSSQIDLNGPQSLPSWLTSGVPPAWLK